MYKRIGGTTYGQFQPGIAGLLGLFALLVFGLAAQLLAPDAAVAAQERQRRSGQEKQAESAAPLEPSSFLGHIVLDGEAGSILSLVLPEEVYLGLQRPDHRDLCVFDAQGIPVPFNLGAAVRDSELPPRNIELPFYPWRPAPGTEGSAGSEGSENPGQAPRAADIEISSGGNIIRIIGQSEGGEAPAGGLVRSPAYYLLDMREYLEQLSPDKGPAASGGGTPAWSGLSLETAGSSDFACYLSMSTSDDFASWRRIGSRQAWIRSRHGGGTLENLTVNLPAGLQRYLLLKLEGDAIIPEKLSARIEFSPLGTRMTRERTVRGEADEQKRGVIYDLGGFLSLRELSFELPQNEIIGVNLYNRNHPESSWSPVGKIMLYRLTDNGAPVTNPPFRLKSSARYWKIEVQDDIPFAAIPALKAGWQPDELRFLARGQSPWTLAFGREHPVSAGSTPLDTLGSAKPAHIVGLGENPALTPAPPAGKAEGAQNWLLWGVLILAVLFLSGVAVWLARSMRKNDGGR